MTIKPQIPTAYRRHLVMQKTINNSLTYQGWGIIFKKPVTIKISPAPINAGIVFNQKILANIDNVYCDNHFVGLKHNRKKILLIEHFLSACLGLGISNLYIDVCGAELPFGDGSALLYLNLLKKVGIKTQSAPRKVLRLSQPILVGKDGSWILAIPSPRLSIILYDHIDQSLGVIWENRAIGDFIKNIARARTFGEYQDITFLKKILPFPIKINNGIALPQKLRYPNEMVRHKMLDFIGDLAFLRSILSAQIIAFNTFHKLNHKFIKRLEHIYGN